jgi:putative transposase
MGKQSMYEIPEDLWKKIQSIIPKKNDSKAGRPRKNDKQIIAGIVYREKFRVSWHEVPKEFGSKSTLHRRYLELSEQGVLEKIFKLTNGLYSNLTLKKKSSKSKK